MIEMSKVPYAFDIGSLMYVMACTMLDIAHVVGVVSRFLTNLRKEHSEAVKWILRYLIGTSKVCLYFGSGGFVLNGYAYSDMTGDVDYRKSILRFLITFAGGTIS